MSKRILTLPLGSGAAGSCRRFGGSLTLPMLVVATALVLAGLASLSARAEPWGNLAGTFVYDGTAPKPEPLTITKDLQVCGKHKLVDESLLVNPSNGGIANLIVYVYVKRGDAGPEIHPSYKEAADKVRLDNDKCRFVPRVTLLTTGQTLVLGNKDPVGHNSKIDTLTNTPINYSIPAGKSIEQTYAAPERLPGRVSCSIHPWMTSWLLIKDTPYMAVTDKDGKFEIKNLPSGEWTFQFWHEKSGYVDEVTVDGKATTWSKGRQEFKIGSGTTDLGTVKVAPKVFED